MVSPFPCLPSVRRFTFKKLSSQAFGNQGRKFSDFYTFFSMWMDSGCSGLIINSTMGYPRGFDKEITDILGRKFTKAE